MMMDDDRGVCVCCINDLPVMKSLPKGVKVGRTPVALSNAASISRVT